MAKLDYRFINFLATDEEASIGLLEDKAVTPKQFKEINTPSLATNAAAGIIRIATHNESIAGINSAAVIVPSKMLPIVWDITAKWTNKSISSLKNWRSICWSPELNLFCAVTYGSNVAATSPDGITWTERILPFSQNWCSVCWSPELMLFCAIVYGNTIAATSPDGINWTERTLPTSRRWYSVCWSPKLMLFCAIASNSSAVATSHDGITWTERTLPSLQDWRSICWSPELRLFCAVAYNSNMTAIYSLL